MHTVLQFILHPKYQDNNVRSMLIPTTEDQLGQHCPAEDWIKVKTSPLL